MIADKLILVAQYAVRQRKKNRCLDPGLSFQGFIINKEDLIYYKQKMLQEHSKKTKYIKGALGRKWFDSFLKCHLELRKKKTHRIYK